MEDHVPLQTGSVPHPCFLSNHLSCLQDVSFPISLSTFGEAESDCSGFSVIKDETQDHPPKQSPNGSVPLCHGVSGGPVRQAMVSLPDQVSAGFRRFQVSRQSWGFQMAEHTPRTPRTPRTNPSPSLPSCSGSPAERETHRVSLPYRERKLGVGRGGSDDVPSCLVYRPVAG